jgi:Tfp pilus assembly protein PilF
MELELFAALEQNKLLSLEKINSGFTRPKFVGQIMLSYYQSKKIVEFLVNQYGFDVIIDLLLGFKQRKPQEKNFEDVFGSSIQKINTAFFDYLQIERKKVQNFVVNKNIFGDDEKKSSPLERLFDKKNSPYFQYCIDGYKSLKDEKYDEAEGYFCKAIDIYPNYVGKGNPYLGLAEVYRKKNNQSSLVNILENYLKINEFGISETLELADHFTQVGDFKKAEYYYTRSFYLEPYEITPHKKLAEIYKKQRLFRKETEQRKIIIALNPVDRAEAYYNLAFGYYQNGQLLQSKNEVLKALELAPGYRDAQKLLLMCADKKK